MARSMFFYPCKATVLTLGKGTLLTKCCPKRSGKQSSSMASNSAASLFNTVLFNHENTGISH